MADVSSSDPIVQRLDYIARLLEAGLRHRGIFDPTVTNIREPVSPARVGGFLPKALGALDMMRAFGIGRTTFWRLELAGEMAPFLLARPIGRKRYSGEKVQRFLNGRGN